MTPEPYYDRDLQREVDVDRPHGWRTEQEYGWRMWWWRIPAFRVGGFFEWTPGDTIMALTWFGWWAVRIGYDFQWTEIETDDK